MQIFGDSFDLYGAPGDATVGYWDLGAAALGFTLQAGRFTGGQCVSSVTNSQSVTVWLGKNSGNNDAVHHLIFAYYHGVGLSGTTRQFYIQLCDGATGQVCLEPRSDGALLLTATPGGTILATYAAAFPANSWTAFEIELVINNTTGSFTVRTNGSATNSFQATALNTRNGTTNNYANRLQLGAWTYNQAPLNVANSQRIDDLLWRSDPAAVPWLGDIRSYTRMPASDIQTQWSKVPATITTPIGSIGGNSNFNANTAHFLRYGPTASGVISSVLFSTTAAATANVKVAIYDSTGTAGGGGAPGNVLASQALANPVNGNNVVTFASPPAVVKGVTYWIAINEDATINYNYWATGGTQEALATLTYATFPQPNPATNWPATFNNLIFLTVNMTPGSFGEVNEAAQDGAASYVYDSNIGDADFYSIGALSVTPSNIVAVTTRGFCEKSDAGTRSMAVQLKSGTATVQSPAPALSTSWGWVYRTDVVDPNTSAAWTPAAVNAAQIGPIVVT